MGCSGSNPKPSTQGRPAAGKTNQPKTPVLVFTLPGTSKDYLQRSLSSEINNQANNDGRLNLRFIDIPNQRNIRRYWLKELSNPRDYAVALYLADLRDHPTLLLTARTLNWFLRNTFKKYDIKIIAIISADSQLQEFRTYLPAAIELLPLNEKDSESVGAVKEMLVFFEEKYQEAKKTRTGTTTTTTHLIMK